MAKGAAKITGDKVPGSPGNLGRTYDGITILKPKTKPTHFTTREIRATIAQVLRGQSLQTDESDPSIAERTHDGGKSSAGTSKR